MRHFNLPPKLLPILATLMFLLGLPLKALASYDQFIPGYCTYYAAQRFDGVAPSPKCNWGGDAGTWLENADTKGWQTDRAATSARVGAVIVWRNSSYGHVAFVESVSSSGITIREMNYGSYASEANRKKGITVNFNKVTTATLSFNQLSRGALTFAGYVFPTRKGAEAGIPMRRYYNPVLDQHFYTTNPNELGNGSGNWIYEGVRFQMKASTAGGAVAFRRFMCIRDGAHFYTASTTEAVGDPNWVRENDMGFIHPPTSGQPGGTVALYRYYNTRSNDHFYTINFNELGNGGGAWIYEGVAGYVLPN